MSNPYTWKTTNKLSIMKTVGLLLDFLILTISLYSQTPSNCIVSPVLREHYDKDIKHLALERIFTQNSVYKDSVEVSRLLQERNTE